MQVYVYLGRLPGLNLHGDLAAIADEDFARSWPRYPCMAMHALRCRELHF